MAVALDRSRRSPVLPIAKSASLDQLSQGVDLRFQGPDGPSPGEKETTATSTAQRVEIKDSGP